MIGWKRRGYLLRIMAIDYGDAHTGVAISDPTGFLAGTTTTIHSRKEDVVLEELSRIAREHQVDEIVMGFPRNMDGTEGPRAQLYRDFGGKKRQKAEENRGRRGRLSDFRGVSGLQTDAAVLTASYLRTGIYHYKNDQTGLKRRVSV